MIEEFTDVWNFPSVRPYKGKHPAEKPLDMLEHAIGATTLPGDIVLDCFAGSGNTAVASLRLGRRAIAIEIEQKWAQGIAAKVRDEAGVLPINGNGKGWSTPTFGKRKNPEPTLFSWEKDPQ